MSYHGEAYKTAQLKAEEERRERIKRNEDQMEEQARFTPVPTIEDIHRATAPRKPREEVVDESAATKTAASDDNDPDKTKTSTPSQDTNKAGYNTRASSAKKQ